MSGTEGVGALLADPELLGHHQLVVDLVYDPPETPFLAAASGRGSTVGNGLPMLVHQAALQFAIWTGGEASIEAMSGGGVPHRRPAGRWWGPAKSRTMSE